MPDMIYKVETYEGNRLRLKQEERTIASAPFGRAAPAAFINWPLVERLACEAQGSDQAFARILLAARATPAPIRPTGGE